MHSEIIISISLGIALGILSGLIPGIHTNTFALILATFSDWFIQFGFTPEDIALIIVANTITHTFLDIIPSVFLGAPEEDTALAILPTHELLLEGRGVEAIKLSATGSIMSALLSLSLIFPVYILLIWGYSTVAKYTLWVLIAVIFSIIWSERGESIYGAGRYSRMKFRGYAFFTLIISGVLGIVVFQYQYLSNPYVEVDSNILFPLLTGLFGIPTLILSSISSPEIPDQKNVDMNLRLKEILRGFTTGTFSGLAVSMFPGISNGVATILSRLLTPYGDIKTGKREFIVSLSSANTSNAIFTLLILFSLGKMRSGAAVFISSITHTVSETAFLIWIYTIGITAILAFFLTLFFGKLMARVVLRVNYTRLSHVVLIFLLIMVFFLNGSYGLVVMFFATLVGFLPILLKVRRVNCMGVIMIPVILYLIGG